jgi:Flp pilus assembly protein TadD
MAVPNKGIANERPKAEWAFGKEVEQNATPPNIWKRLSPWLIGVVIAGVIGAGLFAYYQQDLEERRIKQEQAERYEQVWRENEDIYNEGWKCFDAKDFTEAEERFTRLIGLKHRESALYWARAVVRAASGKDDLALEDYNHSIRLDDRNAGAFNNRGLILWRKGRLEDAQRDFERAIELEPGNKSAHQNKNAVSRARQSNVSHRPTASPRSK